jgi:hypothetical protein
MAVEHMEGGWTVLEFADTGPGKYQGGGGTVAEYFDGLYLDGQSDAVSGSTDGGSHHAQITTEKLLIVWDDSRTSGSNVELCVGGILTTDSDGFTSVETYSKLGEFWAAWKEIVDAEESEDDSEE